MVRLVTFVSTGDCAVPTQPPLTIASILCARCIHTLRPLCRSLTCPDVDGDSRVCCTGGIDVPSLHSCCDPATSRCGVDCTTFPALAPACASLEFINGDTACAINSGYYCTNPGIAPPAAGQASGGGNSTCCNVGMMCRGPTGYSVCCPGAGRTHTCGLDCVTNVPVRASPAPRPLHARKLHAAAATRTPS